MTHLTKRTIDAATYRADGRKNFRDVRWDDDPRGLGLRIFPSGRKSFVLSYRTAGRKRLMALGDYGVLTLDQARVRARQELAALESRDRDPLDEKRRRELEARTGTVKAMFLAYLEDRKPKRSAELLKEAERHIFPTFGKRGWREVRRSEVRVWHQGIEAPYAANRALQSLRAAYYWRLWREDNSPGDKPSERDTRNPCAGIALNQEKRRQVRLEPVELPDVEKAIDAETSDPYLRALFRFVLAVGCRKTEARTLLWSDVRGGSVTFRHGTKSTEELRTVPLSAYAARLLKSLPRVHGNPHVFVGRLPGQPLKAVNKCWDRIRKRAGIDRVRIHDLRRSFGSWLGDEGFSSKQIGVTLGHKSDVTSRVYMALGDRPKQAAVDAMQALLRDAKKVKHTKSKAKVLPFRKRRSA